MRTQAQSRPSVGWVAFFFTALLALPLCALAQARFVDEQERNSSLFGAMDERLSLMPSVAAWKWHNRAPITDPERERVVADRAAALAQPMGLDGDGVRALFEAQIAVARDVQSALHGRWRDRGYDFGTSVPSLENSIRPRLDQLTADILRALHLAVPVANPSPQHLQHWSPASRERVFSAVMSIRRVPVAPLERIAASRIVRIGTTGDYAPFTLEHDGNLTGADIELAMRLARSLGAEAVFIRTTWGSLVEDLRRDAFDLAIGGISITPARQAVAALSVPYSSGGKTILSRCRDARRFAGLPAVDRRGVRVIVNPGGTNEQYVRANVRHAAVRVHPDNRTIFEEIRAGHADVMITDDVEVELQTRRHPDLCRALRGTLTQADKAILMPRDDAFVAAVNAWLATELTAGVPAALLEQNLRR